MLKQYINGKMVMGNNGRTKVINPATEDVAGEYGLASKSQAMEALEAADKAFSLWSGLSLNQRAGWIYKLAEEIELEKEKIVDLLMSETGKPLGNALYDFDMLVTCLKYFIEEAKRLTGAIIPDYDNQFRNMVIRQPLGVVVGYLAWNFPLLNVGYKLGPALASGCTCVLKPSSRTPLATLYIGQIAERIGFPAGVFNIVAGSSDEIAGIMNESSIPRMITLIGSSGTGRTIVRQSSTSVKRFSLELGGNAPVIVMKDADIENAAKQIVGLKYTNSGQVCVSPNRVFVHSSIHEQFISHVKTLVNKIKLGWGRESGVDMGPMIAKNDRDRILALVNDAVEKGAKVVCGGRIPEYKAAGYYMLPTVLDEVTEAMNVYREEIFGPILPVLTFDTRDEAIKKANDTEYGLASYLFTENLSDAISMSEALQFGSVCVNEPFYAVNLPHGGIKESGVGKDCSIYSLEEYYYLKRISIKI